MNTDPAILAKRSVTIAGHSTSISLEEIFWAHLTRIAGERSLSINALVTEIDSHRSGNLSSAIRAYVMQSLTVSEDPSESP